VLVGRFGPSCVTWRILVIGCSIDDDNVGGTPCEHVHARDWWVKCVRTMYKKEGKCEAADGHALAGVA